MKTIRSCVIAGAGMAGLMAAHRLQAAGVRVTLLDKGRGVGGRMATRRIETADERGVCDHGAQFFTVRSPRFQPFVDEWLSAGVVREWTRGFADAGGDYSRDGHPRYCGVNGMNAIAKHLAAGLDVRCGEKVEFISPQPDHWQVTTERGLMVEADALILTPPVPQSLALLDAGTFRLTDDARAALDGISYDPCLALLVVLEAASRIPEPGAIQFNREPITWMADNHRKGISPDSFTVTIHAGPEFTRDHEDEDDELVARRLLHAAGEWLRAPVRYWQVHRWRYSHPQVIHPAACLHVPGPLQLVFAGDAFAGPRVEGAALSGLAAADALLQVNDG